MIDEITFGKSLQPIKRSWWFYTMWLSILIVLTVMSGHPIAVIVYGSIVGIWLILQLALHLNYYLHDKDLKLEVDYLHRIITFQKRASRAEIPFDNVKAIVRVQGSRYPDPTTPTVIPTNFYHYTIIETKDGQKFKFTDLVREGLSFYGVEKELKVRFLNFIL